MSETDCWGCKAEPSIDGTLGASCRDQMAARRPDPATPKLNAHIAKLDDIYTRLCWNCRIEVSQAISGLCPMCEDELRR